jgi:hypothetical protein
MGVYQYAVEHSLNVESVNFLQRPEFLRPTVLPRSVTDSIADQLENWIGSFAVTSDEIVNVRSPNLQTQAALQDALELQHQKNTDYLATDKVRAATGFQASHWLIMIATLSPRQGHDAEPTEAQLILLEALRSAWRDDDSKVQLQSQVSSLLQQYEAIVEQAMNDGLIDKNLNAQLIARLFMAFPIGLTTLTLAGAPDIEPKAFIDVFLRFNEALQPKK